MAIIDTYSDQLRSAHRPAPVSLMTRLALWRSRRALGQLDAQSLADIGVSPAQAMREARRPIWDVPAGWRDGQLHEIA